ncbi:hypothetical protein HDU81_000707, partial [Chytriomyces hyalinus]
RSMKRQRSDDQSDGQEDAAPKALAASPGEASPATLSMILRALENIQATVSAVQKEVADMKETQSSIINSQRHLSNQVLGLENHKKKFFTRLQDVPLEIIVQIFAWIQMQTVLHFKRLSQTINQCLMTREFALLNVQKVDFLKGLEERMDRTWFHLPEPYQTVFASKMSQQLQNVVGRDFEKDATKPKQLPESSFALPQLRNSTCVASNSVATFQMALVRCRY